MLTKSKQVIYEPVPNVNDKNWHVLCIWYVHNLYMWLAYFISRLLVRLLETFENMPILIALLVVNE